MTKRKPKIETCRWGEVNRFPSWPDGWCKWGRDHVIPTSHVAVESTCARICARCKCYEPKEAQ